MRKLSPQCRKTLIRLTGCVLIPASVLIPMLILGPDQVNISGLLNDEKLGLFSHGAGLFMLVWTVFMMHRISEDNGKILLFFLSAFIALFLPYSESHKLISLIHIFSAYAGFILSVLILYPSLRLHKRMMNICALLILFCALHSFTAAKVTGLSECIFAVTFSVTLSLLASEK